MVTNNTIDKSISHNQESITPAITLFSNKFGGKSPDFVAFFRACQESSRWFKSARPLSAAPPTHPWAPPFNRRTGISAKRASPVPGLV